jgi:hypothetical protein
VTRLDLARPREITALFGDSLRVYMRHAGTFLALSAVVVLPVHLAVQGVGMEQLTAGYDNSPDVAETAVPIAVSFLVVAPLINAICIYALRMVEAGERPGAREALVAGFEAFAPIFFAVVLAAIGIAVGLLLLVLPGIYVAVRWYFVPQTVVIEDRRTAGALARSSQIVQGFWWRTLGLVVLVNIAVVVPGLLLSAPFTAIADSADRQLWSLIGAAGAETVTAPFVALFSTLLYYDLRARRQG